MTEPPVLADAVAAYKQLLLAYLDRWPNAEGDEILTMLDDDFMSHIPPVEDVLMSNRALFQQIVAEDVPRRHWETIHDHSSRPTVGWMLMWMIAEEVRFRAHVELRTELADDPRLARVEQVAAAE